MADCQGQCCAVFFLVEDIETRLEEGNIRDGAFIARMIVRLTRRQAVARWRRLGIPIPVKRIFSGRAYFTCRHWNEASRLCTVYDQRPDMCRAHPYGKPCLHADCSCTDDFER